MWIYVPFCISVTRLPMSLRSCLLQFSASTKLLHSDAIDGRFLGAPLLSSCFQARNLLSIDCDFSSFLAILVQQRVFQQAALQAPGLLGGRRRGTFGGSSKLRVFHREGTNPLSWFCGSLLALPSWYNGEPKETGNNKQMRACLCDFCANCASFAKQKKSAESINSRLALVMKGGKYTLGYKSTIKSLRSGTGMSISFLFGQYLSTISKTRHHLQQHSPPPPLHLRVFCYVIKDWCSPLQRNQH